MGTAAGTVIGIDVSKATFDACLLSPDGKPRGRAFPNTPDGFAALLAWADGHGAGAAARVRREATGGHEDALARHLHAAGRTVRVINPTRVTYGGVMRGRRNTTDRADARRIAAYTRDENPPAWPPPSPDVRELQALVRRRDDLRGLAAHEKARLESPLLTPAARRSVARVIKLLGREAAAVRAAAAALIAGTPALAADAGLLGSIPGVGTQTAPTVLAELPALDRVPSAQAAAAYCGLSPREFRSGSSVRGRTRLSKSGNARLRKALYLPTLAAIRFNPVLKGFFDRLVGTGKPKMQAVGACMRKRVMICYGVLKNRAPFDPLWASRIAT
ncbi:transposase is116 is110 is902 family protein : Transposase of an IS110 family member OS=mine drainage metagenome GN=CARN7_1866 PE=4 SV=1: DEDD_Tnp_IS110: Transposase_20 [Gemmataceae bacterium]|nr:transposase is116 is110 is902 family protein : Transposase of an IS110 family member OS=mine drainage metagenome GN=CARN7_1866 PE=4 SV=1: DEDD_Tnp_IS110: Transposase_20 [Gemmataceae bacterium]VTU01805.1 transposase is116 is110 is902 family protein : Transposase of an IS110 family member OS=mine drainage metagenome GN=CARN7_1866 PE=4 SV=1: DEDD_Tnp_IS110: Transposase_20 [Gemmataceae bacterium]